MDRIQAAEVFVAIVERGSLTAAADGLDMSRAMVTRYLAQMEDWSGARLLHRTTRRIGLTAAGEATLVRCRQMLEIAGQMAMTEGPEADTPRGLLRIACAQVLAQQVLGAAVTAFLRRYPQTAIDLVVDNRTINLVEERIDPAAGHVRIGGGGRAVVPDRARHAAPRGRPGRAQLPDVFVLWQESVEVHRCQDRRAV
jgi:DNA-binding transcriptional LysR family regulator